MYNIIHVPVSSLLLFQSKREKVERLVDLFKLSEAEALRLLEVCPVCVCVCVCVCARACVHACVHACVRACVHACVRVHVMRRVNYLPGGSFRNLPKGKGRSRVHVDCICIRTLLQEIYGLGDRG